MRTFLDSNMLHHLVTKEQSSYSIEDRVRALEIFCFGIVLTTGMYLMLSDAELKQYAIMQSSWTIGILLGIFMLGGGMALSAIIDIGAAIGERLGLVVTERTRKFIATHKKRLGVYTLLAVNIVGLPILYWAYDYSLKPLIGAVVLELLLGAFASKSAIQKWWNKKATTGNASSSKTRSKRAN